MAPRASAMSNSFLWARILNKDSRVRSAVGRVSRPFGAVIERPENFPPTIRIANGLRRDDAHQDFDRAVRVRFSLSAFRFSTGRISPGSPRRLFFFPPPAFSFGPRCDLRYSPLLRSP